MRPAAGMPLWLAIALALAAKIIILMALHKAFFAAPQAKKMRMPTPAVEHHLLGLVASVPPSPPPAKAQP
jgi:hypothetical protein